MSRLQAKSFAQPDEVRTMPGLRVETVGLDEATVGHCSFDPGWRWSTDLAPLLGTPSCPIRHVGYSMSGQLRVVMDDGARLDVGPGTVFEIPAGHDKWVLGDEPWVAIEWGASSRAMVVALHEPTERSLVTVMFTDIVNSTAIVERLGDDAWHDLLIAHNALMRDELNVFRGREMKTTGDGFLAVFDSATRAVRCAAAMIRASGALNLPIRVGLHTGEVEFVGSDVRGIAVHAAARVMALAGPNQVMLSSTTSGLIEGSDLILEDAGVHKLKGLSGQREVFRLVEPPGT